MDYTHADFVEDLDELVSGPSASEEGTHQAVEHAKAAGDRIRAYVQGFEKGLAHLEYASPESHQHTITDLSPAEFHRLALASAQIGALQDIINAVHKETHKASQYGLATVTDPTATPLTTALVRVFESASEVGRVVYERQDGYGDASGEDEDLVRMRRDLLVVHDELVRLGIATIGPDGASLI